MQAFGNERLLDQALCNCHLNGCDLRVRGAVRTAFEAPLSRSGLDRRDF